MTDLYEPRQAGATFSDLGGLANKTFELIERVGDDSGNLRKRWDNRLVLERSSLSELYVNGRIEIVIYGDWGGGKNNIHWLCCISAHPTVLDDASSKSSVDICYAGDCNSRQDEVVLVVVVEDVKGPKRLVRSVGRTYLIENKIYRTEEGGLYRLQVLNGRSVLGYKVFPFLPHRKMSRGFPLTGVSDSGSQMIEGTPKIVNSVSNDESNHFRDWFKREVSQREPGWLCVGRNDVALDSNAIPFFGQRGRFGDQFVNVAIGPLNL